MSTFIAMLFLLLFGLNLQLSASTEDWYLSGNGIDSLKCGASLVTSCLTFDWLLARFYNTSYSTNNTLILFTDADVVIDEKITIHHPWLQSLRVQMRMPEPVSMKFTPKLRFVGVDWSLSEWKIHGLDFFLEKSSVMASSFKLTSVGLERTGRCEIKNSTFANITLEQYDINISGCIIDGTKMKNPTLLDVASSRLTITSSILSKMFSNAGATLLAARNSAVALVDILVSENSWSEGFLRIHNTSSLLVKNGHISRSNITNGSALFKIEDSSNLTLVDSKVDLTTVNGSVVYAEDNSSVSIDNCTIKTADHLGSAVICRKGVSLSVVNSDLRSNIRQNKGIVELRFNCVATFSDVKFVGNSFHRYIEIQTDVTLDLKRCFFDVANSSTEVIRIQEKCYVALTASIFRVTNLNSNIIAAFYSSNVTVQGTVIQVRDDQSKVKTMVLKVRYYSKATIINCTFSGMEKFLSITLRSSVYVSESSIANNAEKVEDRSMIEIQQDSHLLMVNSNITSTAATSNSSSPLIDAKTECSVGMFGCVFYGTRLSVVDASDNTKVTFHDCKFLNNTNANGDVKSVGLLRRGPPCDESVSITNTLIENNALCSNMVDISCSSNFTIKNTTVRNVKLLFVLGWLFNIVSNPVIPATILLIDHSNFTVEPSSGFLMTKYVRKVLMQSSQITFNSPKISHSVSIQDSTVTRIADSKFINVTLLFSKLYNLPLFLTYKSSFSAKGVVLRSSDADFMARALHLSIIWGKGIQHEETAYASLEPVHCTSPPGYNCRCHHNYHSDQNIYSCESPNGETSLPHFIHNHTDSVVVRNGNVTKLCDTYPYLDNIEALDLRQNGITRICEHFTDALNQSKSIGHIWLSENPFHCDCSMAWMTAWMNTFTTSMGEHVVVDYKYIICHSGKMIGTPVHKLEPVAMGCFPPKLTLTQKIAIGVTLGIGSILIAWLTVLVIKRSRDIKFLLYYYCKWCFCCGVPRDDKNEDLSNMLYDAFILYSTKDTAWVSEVLRRNKWKVGCKLFDLEKDHGFRLMVPQRDFLPQLPAAQQIGEGMDRSRKIIFIISRNFLRSGQKLWWFKAADAEALKKRKIVVIFKEKLELRELCEELKTYQKLRLGIQPDANMDKLTARIRFNMPRRPLSELRPQDFPKVGDEDDAFNDYDDETDSEQYGLSTEEGDGNHSNDTACQNNGGQQSDGCQGALQEVCGSSHQVGTVDDTVVNEESPLLVGHRTPSRQCTIM